MNTTASRPDAAAFAGLPAAAIVAFAVSILSSPGSLSAQTAPVRPPGQTAAGDARDITVLSAFEVTEESGLGYRATKTLAGAGIATEIRDLPSSISVLNREFMDDLMVTNIEELSKFFMSGEFEPAPEASISSGGAVRMRGIPTGNLRDASITRRSSTAMRSIASRSCAARTASSTPAPAPAATRTRSRSRPS